MNMLVSTPTSSNHYASPHDSPDRLAGATSSSSSDMTGSPTSVVKLQQDESPRDDEKPTNNNINCASTSNNSNDPENWNSATEEAPAVVRKSWSPSVEIPNHDEAQNQTLAPFESYSTSCPASPKSSKTTLNKHATDTNSSPSSSSSSFIKYCKFRGPQVAQEPRHSLPLNRLLVCETGTMAKVSSALRGGMAYFDRQPQTQPQDKQQSQQSQQSQQQPQSQQPQEDDSNSDDAYEWLLETYFGSTMSSSSSFFARDSSYYIHHRHRLGHCVQALSFRPHDILQVALDDATFQSLKVGLRRRGVITNNYLRENIHFFLRHAKENAHVKHPKQPVERLPSQPLEQQHQHRGPLPSTIWKRIPTKTVTASSTTTSATKTPNTSAAIASAKTSATTTTNPTPTTNNQSTATSTRLSFSSSRPKRTMMKLIPQRWLESQ